MMDDKSIKLAPSEMLKTPIGHNHRTHLSVENSHNNENAYTFENQSTQ